jgi:hypothetical protein
VSFVIPAHEGDHVGRPEDFGSDPLDELHSLSVQEVGATDPIDKDPIGQPSTNSSSS